MKVGFKLKTKEDVINLIKTLEEQGAVIYWRESSGRLVISPRKKPYKLPNTPPAMLGPSIAKELTAILDIKSKKDWMTIKEMYNL